MVPDLVEPTPELAGAGALVMTSLREARAHLASLD